MHHSVEHEATKVTTADDQTPTNGLQPQWAPYPGTRIGEAARPGPTHNHTMLLESGNISHLTTARATIQAREAHIFFGQEHSLQPKDYQHNRREMKPWSSHFSSLDLENEKPTGGTCAHRPDGKPTLTPRALSKHLLTLNGKGRVQLYALELTPQVIILVYNICMDQCQQQQDSSSKDP